MKSVVALALGMFGFNTLASAEVLLNCTYIDQPDISSAVVQTYANPAKKYTLELVLTSPSGETVSLPIDSEDYNEGWIVLPSDEAAERYLTRQQEGWEIFGAVGQKTYFATAICEEKPE
ncbi:MAG: hypothetical protein OM95_02940 [Bdellovibrio sp. ArHS]|uniref:hypothetical protein n=1 Tax=Bdellovibrio sp. ArHS TaxID=1569284 RepID=UPI00058368EE|nr:hypothetical protein [Bdellovibrio sp. ArHS]KHD89552.1 MAG: hypothetical protein OM95_02940 [Bdellovibrio sp. ArHS]